MTARNLTNKMNEKYLMQVTTRLIEILTEENAYLERMDISIVNKYMEEKIALIISMTQAKKLLTENPEIKRNFSPNKIQKIKDQYKVLEEVMAKNFALISYGKAANRRIIEAIKSSKRKHLNVSTYNKDGRKKEDSTSANVEQKV